MFRPAPPGKLEGHEVYPESWELIGPWIGDSNSHPKKATTVMITLLLVRYGVYP